MHQFSGRWSTNKTFVKKYSCWKIRELDNIKMDESDETQLTQNSNEMEIEIETETVLSDVKVELDSIFKILTPDQIQGFMNQYIDVVINDVKSIVSVSSVVFIFQNSLSIWKS